MKSARTFLILLLLILVVLTQFPHVQADQNDDLAKKSDLVVDGEVKGIESRQESGLVFSYVTFLVREVRKGSDSVKEKGVVIRVIGGEVETCKVLWRSDQAYFALGETARVYLRQTDDLYEVVDGHNGKTGVDKTSLEPITRRTAAGYLLSWFRPPNEFLDSTSRPGSDWYGPFKWDSGAIPVEYWVDTRNIPSGISVSSFTSVALSCYQTWEDDPGSTIDYTYMGTRTDLGWGSNDGVNIFCWRYIDGAGHILGVTQQHLEYVIGNYDSMRIVDADVELDTGDLWSAGDVCSSGRFDVQSVGTHEVGHNVGLADLSESEDWPMTMYGTTSPGETYRRDLAWGDQAGVRALYPTPIYAVTFFSGPTSGTISADPPDQFFANGASTSYFSGARVHVIASSPTGYTFSYWETGGGVNVDSSSLWNTYMTVFNNGYLKAYFAVTSHIDISTAASYISSCGEYNVYFIYPDYQGVKPPGVTHAWLSDWTATGFVVGTCSNHQYEGTDTNSALIDDSTGAPKITDSTIVLFAGPVVSAPVHYYEGTRVAPVYWGIENGVHYWYRNDGTCIDATAMPNSQVSNSQDMFLVETFIDSSGNKVFIVYGYGWKGTFAAGLFFKSVICPNMSSYSNVYYVYRWTDSNGDGFVDLGEIGGTPVVSG